MAGKMYAWSEIRKGGEVKTIDLADGRTKTLVVSRNTVAVGDVITKKSLDFTDDEWDALIDAGSIRPYPYPEEAGDYVSPTQAILAKYSRDGDVDQNMLLELALAHPAASNPPAEEGAEVPAGV